MERARPVTVRNICLIGSTGSGKSTTGNMLYHGCTDTPFMVGNDAVSCTFFADQHTNTTKGVRILDTPGFGDNRFHEKEVDKIIRDLTLMLTNPTVDSSGVIDAFLLPVKFNPRPSTLKSDLEHFMDLFGTVALKSLIILPIFMDSKKRTENDIVTTFSKMTEIVNMLKEGKNEEPNAKWFCLWDNLNPVPGQEENLFNKMTYLEPYTHKKFVEAADEIKRRLDARVQEEVDRLITRAKNDFAHDKEKLEAKVKEIEAKAAEEKRELKAAQDRAQEGTARFVEALERMTSDNKAEMARLYEQMSAEREQNNAKMRELAESMNSNNQKQMAALMKSQAEQNAKMHEMIIKMAPKEQPRRSGICNLF